MQANEAKKKYDIQYAKNNLKRIPLNVQKEKYEKIKVAADSAGETVNGYIKRSIDLRMERESRQGAFPSPICPDTVQQAVNTPAPGKHYKPFTEDDARRIDLQELLANTRYQVDICSTFGMDVLAVLLEKAREAATVPG